MSHQKDAIKLLKKKYIDFILWCFNLVTISINYKHMEIWKSVPGFGNHYEASNLGNVRVKDKIIKKKIRGKIASQFYKGKILKQIDNGHGYNVVRFGYDGKRFTQQTGRMILMAFKGMPKDGEMCCHNNSDPRDNRIENLRWGDQKDNMKDRVARGKYLSCENHAMARLNNKEVLEIYNSNETGIVLAEKYKISTNAISRIRKGKCWKDITGGKDRKTGKLYIGTRPHDKFNPDKIREIRKLRKDTNMFYKNIAKIYDTSEDVICKICTRKSWSHIE